MIKFLFIVKEMETLIRKDRYNNKAIEDFKKKDFADETKFPEALTTYISENCLKIFKAELADIWMFLNKN